MIKASGKIHLLLSLLVVNQTICLSQDKPSSDEKRTWGTSHIRELEPNGETTRLALFDVSQRPQHLLGTLSLSRPFNRKDVQLIIKGHYDDLGEFAPNVAFAVSDRRDGDWKTIESSLSESDELILTGAPHVDKLLIKIKLDAFQPFIGKFRYCRVTIQTGESDVFPMVWLTEKGE